MTTFVVDGGGGPRTHALIIGVGKYDNLVKPSPAMPVEFRRMSQLPEAELSARSVADWLVDHAAELDPPLGTVEMLASQPPHGLAHFDAKDRRGSQPLHRPSLARTRQAAARWRATCDAHDGNAAFFYFAGHGILTTDTLLLLQDFAANPTDPFVEAINLDNLYLGLKCCKASMQLVFADSCQKASQTAQSLLAPTRGNPLIGAQAHQLRSRNALKVNASAPGGSAWAAAGQPTQFAKALLPALNGAGAEQDLFGDWHVTLAGIADALRVELARGAKRGGPYQHPTPTTEGDAAAAIRRLNKPPQVPVEVTCLPDVAIQQADLELAAAGTSRYSCSRPTDITWTTDVDPDLYHATADFPIGHPSYIRDSRPAHVYPPRKDIQLKVMP